MFLRKIVGTEKIWNSFATAPPETSQAPLPLSISLPPKFQFFAHTGICTSAVYLCGTEGHLTL